MPRRNKKIKPARAQDKRSLLNLQWRRPLLPTGRTGATEIAWFRFGDDEYRVRVVPISVNTYAQGGVAQSPQPATAHGWGVEMNGEVLAGEPLAFVDAVYAGWASFVESIPQLARFSTQGVIWSAARLADFDLDILEVEVVHGHDKPPTHPGAGEGGKGVAGPDPERLRAAAGAQAEAGDTPI